MTKKTFVSVGLFLVMLGPISIALQTFLLLSKILPIETNVYFDLSRYVVIPLTFGLLMWKHLIYIGKSRRFTACSLVGFLAAFVMSMVLFPLILLYLGSNPGAALANEIAIWSVSVGKGDFNFSVNAKIKMAAYHAIILALANWPLFAALYFGAGGPRFPRGKNQFFPLSKNTVEKDNSTVSLKTQMVS